MGVVAINGSPRPGGNTNTLMREVIAEDMVPLIKFREQLERKAFNKAHAEMEKLEEEV